MSISAFHTLRGRVQRVPRVLVIEDDDLLREALCQTLADAGYTADAARDGGEGLRRYQKTPADLVITDIFMPGKEGIETIIKLRRQHPEAKIIAISGGGSCGAMDYLAMAAKLGADRTMAKPIRREGLLEAVRAALACKGAVRTASGGGG